MPSTMSTDSPFDFAPHPGRILQRELDAREISQAQLAARTGLSTKHVNLVIKGTAPLSADVAVTLEEILGVSAEMWLSLEASRQAHEARAERQNALAGYSDWATSFSRPLLVERGVIDSADHGASVVAKLLGFFGVASPHAFEKTWLEPQASYKRSQQFSIDANLTALWLRLAERQAIPIALGAPVYDQHKLREAAAGLPGLTTSEPAVAFREAQSLLLEAGVVLVFVAEIPNTRISGVSRWINKTPMIAVTSRYNALDSLWFTLLHEIAHVLLHPKRSTFIDGDRANDDDDAQETAANDFAENTLIPASHRDALIAASSVGEIQAIAEDLGVSPALVAGQWAHLKKNWAGPIAKLRYRKGFDLAEVLRAG